MNNQNRGMNEMKITTMTIAAIALSTSFAAASTSSFEGSLKAAEQVAKGETALKECIKTTNLNTLLGSLGLTKADLRAAPQYMQDQIEDETEKLADLTLRAVDVAGGDYIKAVEGLVLHTVKGGVYSAGQGKEFRDSLVACFEVAK